MTTTIDVGAAPRSLGQRAVAGAGHVTPFLLMAALALVATFGLYVHLVRQVGGTMFERSVLALVVCTICLLPPVLIVILALVLRRARVSRLEFELSEPTSRNSLAMALGEGEQTLESATRLWTHEVVQLGSVSQRVVTHATMFGLVCMITLGAASSSALTPFSIRQWRAPARIGSMSAMPSGPPFSLALPATSAE